MQASSAASVENDHAWWMIRAEAGALFAEFERKKCVALGWPEIGNLSAIADREAIRKRYEETHPDSSRGKAANVVGMLYKFSSVLQKGDRAVTYNPESREYLIGQIVGDYAFEDAKIPSYPHLRSVNWLGRVHRDSLKLASRNSLGSTLTLFSIPEDAAADLAGALAGAREASSEVSRDDKEDLAQLKHDAAAKAIELIKDRILQLDEDDAEELVAAVLRAMGYKAHVTPKGTDRGVDVIASPDGLGLETPRIKAEVKHRSRTSIGSQDLRSFLGGLREGDRGLYVSTGGFTKDARYEADRSNHPLTLIGLGELASLIIDHYEAFDTEGRVLFPLVKVYMPA